MQVITIASQKGGVGKSMLTRHLAVEIERMGAGPVAITDADPQGGSVAWWKERKADTPVMIKSDEGLKAVEATARRMGFAFLVMNKPPNLSDRVEEAIGMADFVIVPSKPSIDDLRAIGPTVKLIKRAKTPMTFVINMVKPRVKATADAVDVLARYATVAPVKIYDRAIYAASGIDGRTAPEVDPNGDAAGEIGGLWVYVNECMAEVAA